MGTVLGAPKGASGSLILEFLSREGWSISIVPGEVRLLARAKRGDLEVEATGESIAALAPYLAARARMAVASVEAELLR